MVELILTEQFQVPLARRSATRLQRDCDDIAAILDFGGLLQPVRYKFWRDPEDLAERALLQRSGYRV